MAFDHLRPQSPRTVENSRHPAEAVDYGARALALSAAAAAGTRAALDVPYGDGEIQQLDVYLPADAAARDLPVLLFFHGGAWMHGYKEWNGLMAPALVDLPAIFVTASYRLAPEHKFPAPLQDAFAALKWVHENIASHGGDAGRIFIGGWSVGGTLATLITLRRDLYGEYALPADPVKACFTASGGYRYLHHVPAPGNSGRTYGDIMFAHAGDDYQATALNFAAGNRTPFHISNGAGDFEHVRLSSADMAAALEQERGRVHYEVYEGLGHYAVHLAMADREFPWVKSVRQWMAAPPDAQAAVRQPASSSAG